MQTLFSTHPGKSGRRAASFPVLCVLFVLFSFFLLSVSGCSSAPVRRAPPQGPVMLSVQQAEERFGPPHSTMVQGDGLTRRTWVFHKEHYTPEKQLVWHPLFFRENFYTDRVITKPEKLERFYCVYNLYTNSEDVLVSSSWDGNFCEAVVQNNLFRRNVNGLP